MGIFDSFEGESGMTQTVVQLARASESRWRDSASNVDSSIYGHALGDQYRIPAEVYQKDTISCGLFCIHACETITQQLLGGQSLDFVEVGAFDGESLRLDVLNKFHDKVKKAKPIIDEAQKAKQQR